MNPIFSEPPRLSYLPIYANVSVSYLCRQYFTGQLWPSECSAQQTQTNRDSPSVCVCVLAWYFLVKENQITLLHHTSRHVFDKFTKPSYFGYSFPEQWKPPRRPKKRKGGSLQLRRCLILNQAASFLCDAS